MRRIDLFSRVLDQLASGRSAVVAHLVTRKNTRAVQSRALLYSPPLVIGDDLDHESRKTVIEHAARVFEETRLTELVELGESSWLFLDYYRPQPTLLILGAGHIARVLARLAKMLSFHVIVADDRLYYCNAQRFPDADRLLVGPFPRILDDVEVGPETYVVVVTRGHRHDEDCMRRLVPARTAYLGMIGSRRRVGGVLKRLEEEGVLKTGEAGRIYAPIGLDIGAESPEEIAVSIISEIIKVRRGGTGQSLNSIPRTGGRKVATHVDKKFLKRLLSGFAYYGQVVILTVARTTGSTPREVGAKMLLFPDGSSYGTLGGGCAEAEALREARMILREGGAIVHSLDLTASFDEEEGSVCGGTMQVFIERVD